jgi:tetratricopeptide (TPR) repeat protein
MYKIFKAFLIFFFCISLILITSCYRKTVSPVEKELKSSGVKLYPLEGKRAVYFANTYSTKDLKDRKIFAAEGLKKTCKPYPKKFSKKYNREIVKSKELYEKKEYQKAAGVLKVAVTQEPGNPFLLEAYARALLRQDLRKESFVYYKRLIELLDRNPAAKKIGVRTNDIIVDCWFPEAYWKLATLLLDNGEWEAAAFEISRSLLATQDQCNTQPIICIQAFSYLTAAYYEMKKYDIAKYYANIVLELDPSNEYVKDYLSKMK